MTDSNHSSKTSNPQETSNPSFSYESSQFVRVPQKRIGAIIGAGGNNRKEIEKNTQSVIIIDSATGEVEIRPGSELRDPVMLLKAAEIVKAIGRGFYYKTALKLIKDDYYLDVIRLKSSKLKNPQQIRRIKSRIIGTNGKTKASIEQLTKTDLVISGSTVSLIGTYEQITTAHDAVVRLINGSPIESVIKSLEDKRKDDKKANKKMWKDDDDIPNMEESFAETEEEDVFSDFEEEE